MAKRFERRRWSLFLCFLAGYLNVLGILMVAAPTSHFTGNASQLVLALGAGETGRALLLLVLFFSFIFGSGLSGFLSTKFETTKLYVLTLQVIGLLLLIASFFPDILLGATIAFTLGFQNALGLYYRGTKVRTTHITGYLTDLGYELGHSLGVGNRNLWKVSYFGISILIFILGGGVYYMIHSISIYLPLPIAGVFYILTSYIFKSQDR
ncbi:MAG: YoaK family protein [Tissierellia bacterium]|nr:YoaK family protein [Tissierellia bacterium]